MPQLCCAAQAIDFSLASSLPLMLNLLTHLTAPAPAIAVSSCLVSTATEPTWSLAWIFAMAIGTIITATIVFLCGLALLFLACIFVLPKPLALKAARLCFLPFYRIHLHHRERLPTTGGALLVANHVSYLDGLLMLVMSDRPVRMMVYAGNFQSKLMQRAGRRWGAILVASGPKSIVRSLKTARDAIAQGELVGIFPEGGITRSGVLQSFRPGLLKIVADSDAPIVPIYFDGLWGSIFSFERHKFFWKTPKCFPYRIDIHYGEPIRGISAVHPVRQTVQQLGTKAVNERLQRKTELPESVIRACKKRKFQSKVADSAGADLTGGSVLMRSLILRRLLRREVLADDEQYVGILIPPSSGGVITNLAVTFDRRVAVNLNYTVSSDVMNECIRLAGIRHVLTSRKVMEKLDLQIDCELVYLEDFKTKVKLSDKILSALEAYALPANMLCRSLRLHEYQPDDVLTIIFTSGSTGIPKGVMLTHANIRSNVDAINQVIAMKSTDTIAGILPFFHSFGFTVTMWTVMALNIKGVYHFNPLDAKQVGKLISKHKATILLSTPTFLRSYLRRCEKAEFATLDTVVAGAEKLPKELCDAFEKKFGLRPVEGYGTTELSPLVSVNVPPSRSAASGQIDAREGTVGRCVEGVSAKIVDADGNELPTNHSGMLLIAGPNVMKGYLHQPDKTAEVIHDGWYVTGDIAFLDDDGFITITGRESRFSKIGGEMVPHLKIEESLMELIGSDDNGDEGELKVAVTSVADAKKGERLVVLYTSLPQTPEELVAGLRAKGLPNLFIPSPDSFHHVENIPILGTGKLDLKGLKDLAQQAFADA
ncbi:MAG: AMP-binding protein [Planctomycetales bacterium]|nr:AMP-binding protein [Planctomycetales bacterium]